VFTGVRVHSYATVDHAVVLPEVDIGQGARLRNVIIERGVRIPPGLVVGEDADDDIRRQFQRTPKGVCLITQAMIDRLTP
jgi:glucose-1-phosphate adenylyltransferase